MKHIAVLSPVAWRTPPRAYGAWETVASNIAEGLVKRGWEVTLFATGDSLTKANLASVIDKGYEEDPSSNPKVAECLHISEIFEKADDFDLIHNNFDFLPLTYSRLVDTPMLTTIHGFSCPTIMPVYHKYRDGYYVSISDSDRAEGLNYLGTVYNGIDVDQMEFHSQPGNSLVFLGRIHPDKGAHLAIEVAKKTGQQLLIAGIVQDKNYFDSQIAPHIDEDQIKYLGPVGPEERNALLQKASAVLHLNTIPERFGLVMAEAMAAGVPVIAMDKGSCREVVADGTTGFLVNDIAEAAEAVEKVDNLSRRACRQRVEDNFSIEVMVDKYIEVYKEIFRREQGRRR
ncbi:MAG: glycosyltransferase family 4 protein [Chlamydiota bacterium]